jgi:hypothetical protein
MHARAPWAPADIPSYQQVALRFSKCKQYKTAAEDGMAPDLAHSNPLLYAKAFHPLYLKAILLTLPPIQFTGGQGCELYKGCGDPSEIINFRDVHISTSPGTVFAGIMRVPLASRLQGGAIDTQYGAGLNAGGADFTHLAARATLDLADARNMSCALLFVDIKTAFAALQRFLVLPIPEALPSFRVLLVQSGFSGPFIDEWMIELETLLPWSRLPGKDALLDLIAALHQFSWMSTEGLDGVMHLAQGSLAGNPLGDIIFSAGMTVLVKRLRASIVKLGHLSQLDDPTLRAVVEPVDAILQQPQQPFPYVADVSYVDDLILPLILPAEQIEKALPLVLAAAHETYYMCGFEINWKPKKTSIILVFKGPLSRKVSRHFAVNYPGAVPFTDYTGTQREAPIVQQYKHMGGQLRANGVVLPELKARYSSLQSMIKPLEKRIFANPFIPVDKKLYTAQTILYTRLLYNAGTWPSLNLVELRYFHSRMMTINRHVVQQFNNEGSVHTSDVEILQSLEVPAPQVILRVLRLRLFVRVAKHAPIYILTLIRAAAPATRSWVAAIDDDLKYFCDTLAENALDRLLPLPVPTFLGSLREIRARPKSWAQRFTRLLTLDIFRTQVACAIDVTPSTIRDNFVCPECEGLFSDFQRMQSHRAQIHGYRNHTRDYIDTTFCRACFCEYTSYHNLEAHLLKGDKTLSGKRCLQWYIAHVPTLTPEQRVTSDAVFVAEYKKNVSLGVCTTHIPGTCFPYNGPLLCGAAR